MSYSDIVKTYSSPTVEPVLVFTTNDMPIQWSIRIHNGNRVDINLIGHDKSVKLDECQTWVTVISSSTYYWFVASDGPIPKDGFFDRITCETYDSVEVKIRIKNTDQPDIECDFKTPEANHDRVLVIQGEKFYIQSAYLSTWSKYFDRMFNGEFAEKDKTEIEIKDVYPAEFEELLKVIYPTRKNIDHTNVVYLWKLADRCDIPTVAKMCERYLTTTPGFYMLPFWEKYDLAEAMNSEELKKMCRETKTFNAK